LPHPSTPLTPQERATLLRLARESIERRLAHQPPPAALPGQGGIALTARLLAHSGAFVTLNTRAGELRGCVGMPYPVQPLYEAVIESAGSAAIEDPRFEHIRAGELADLRIEISVLTQPVDIQQLGVPAGASPRRIAAAIRPGTHGLLISQGHRRGLLLPQVATEYGWSAERFLAETCRKAGLDADAWQRGARIEVFTAEIIHET
jgi:AmmeMemoRadiSam system protein A